MSNRRYPINASLVLLVTLLAGAAPSLAAEPPTVFRVPDRVGPGDVVLLYGGGLAATDGIAAWRLPDADLGQPGAGATPTAPADAATLKPLQPGDGSVKFVLPAALEPGVFAVQVRAGDARAEVRVLNRPEFWFLQPTTLRPGLAVNQAPPGAEVQVVGKNLTTRGDRDPHPRLALRPKAGGGPAVDLPVTRAEPFSLTARLPEGLPVGDYELFAHPGKGGPAAWGGPLAVAVRRPIAWPATVFNVRDFGAKGDDVTDDTKAVRDALAAAEKNGGGVVYVPWGTYRLSDWVAVPARTVVRGEARDAAVLKWPLDPPKDEKDFLKAAVYVGPECGLEDLTLVARRVETILLDVQYELNVAKTVPPELTARVRPWGRGGDLFLRRLLVQHLLLAGRPEQQKPVMENPALNKRYWEGLRNALVQDGRNTEVSDCSFEGGDQLFTNLVNGRIVRNAFANHMGYSWTNLGGGA
ncbi:MAG TPA: glycosyl hydrolase family 28-related protein, partial [Humisphaera sp.]